MFHDLELHAVTFAPIFMVLPLTGIFLKYKNIVRIFAKPKGINVICIRLVRWYKPLLRWAILREKRK